MARINNLVNFLTDIANAIRNKTGKSQTIQPVDMDTEIGSIQTQPNLQSKSVEITENTTTNITADSGYDGLSDVEVITNVSGGSSEYNAKYIPFDGNYAESYRYIAKITEITMSPERTSLNNLFNTYTSLAEIGAINNTSNCIQMAGLFQNCQNLVTAPLFDTSNIKNMNNCFNNCTSLVNIPLYNTSNVTSFFNNTFYGCPNLSNTSLNNILAMCANSAITSYRTLKRAGLSSEQADICETLSNWDAFIAAGWSKGY